MLKPDLLRIDSHKLVFHPRRVAQWLEGQRILPLYLEISPAGSCNHRCTFCALDFMEYRPRYLDSAVLLERLREMGALGVKSVMYAGEGEPLLHPDIAVLVEAARAAGLDVAMTTNGALLSPQLAQQILPHLSWIKVSIDAGTPESYAAIHGTGAAGFARVLENVASAAALAAANGWPCTIGTQAVLLPENAAEMELLAARCREAGAHYLVIKPYSQHAKSLSRRYAGLEYPLESGLAERLSRFNDENFRVVYREQTFAKLTAAGRGYQRCLALPFWGYVDSCGDVWGCSSHLGDPRFRYGNLASGTVSEVWGGAARERCLAFVERELDPEGCRLNCRMDEINRYLWELTHPSEHVNFI